MLDARSAAGVLGCVPVSPGVGTALRFLASAIQAAIEDCSAGAGGTSAIPSTSSFSSQETSTTYNDFQAPLQLSYELDFFGRIRHSYGQARASAQATDAAVKIAKPAMNRRLAPMRSPRAPAVRMQAANAMV